MHPAGMVKRWLEYPTTVEEAERVQDLAGWGEWLHFREQMREGDQLWTFSTPIEAWENDMGCAGLCILRGGEVVSPWSRRRTEVHENFVRQDRP
ncbi:MAG TPA: hypothetical protein VK997_12990 [Deferrisomatales bacterium]|nr:hypothetical protein [Deferrisomatales bacterium]